MEGERGHQPSMDANASILLLDMKSMNQNDMSPADLTPVIIHSEVIKPRWSKKKKICFGISLLILTGLIIIGALVPFCIKTPTITVTKTTFTCQYDPCTALQTITATTYIDVYNPNILSPTVYADLSVLNSARTNDIGDGSIPSTVVTKQSTTQLIATFLLPPSSDSFTLWEQQVTNCNTCNTQIIINGTITLQITSLIKPKFHLDQTVTI